MEKIYFGYDFLTHKSPIPNCFNPIHFDLLIKHDFNYDSIKQDYFERVKTDLPIYNDHSFDVFADYSSVYNLRNERFKGSRVPWFYIIEPHSNIDYFFGSTELQTIFSMEFMSQKAIEEVREGNGNILINYTIDGGQGINMNNFKKLFDFLDKNGISQDKVFLVFSDFKLKNNLTKLGYNINYFDYMFYLMLKAREFNNFMRDSNVNIITEDEFIKSIGNERKDFLFFTGRFKMHRLLILNQLYKLGFDNSLISYKSDLFHDDLQRKFLQYDNNQSFIDEITKGDKVLDVPDLYEIRGFGHEDKSLFLNSYISVVAESIFFQSEDKNNPYNDFPSGFLSEKIWKPVGHCQPFILAGPSKSLEYIRERYGFKTFHPYIDESYDLENDDFKRLQMILDEMVKFSKKTSEEKVQFLENVKDICLHNQKLFLRYGNEDDKILEEMNLVNEFLTKDLYEKIRINTGIKLSKKII